MKIDPRVWGAVATITALVSIVSACAPSPASPPVPSSGGPSSSTTEDVITVPRFGYDAEPPSIGDPAAVVTGPTGEAVMYGGAPVIQACSIVTVQDIRAAGALLWANGLAGAIERRFFDGHGPAPMPIMAGSLPFKVNSCDYILAPNHDRGGVHVTVHQPTYAHPDAIATEAHRGHRPIEPINGVTIHAATRPLPDRTSAWLLQLDDKLVELSVNHPQEHTKQAILTAAARHLAELTAHPTGPPRFNYDSPAFPAEHANPCDLFDNKDFQAVFGQDAQALAVEWLASAIGVINYGLTGGPDRDFNYIDRTCRRLSPDENPRHQHSLTVETTTYETDQPACIRSSPTANDVPTRSPYLPPSATRHCSPTNPALRTSYPYAAAESSSRSPTPTTPAPTSRTRNASPLSPQWRRPSLPDWRHSLIEA